MRPLKIKLPFQLKSRVLALGSQAKNTVCFAAGNFASISPLAQNLNNLQDFLNFTKAVDYFLKKCPKIIACDLHPEYQSTKYTSKLNAKRYTLYAIQHHHAHTASCMAENGLKNQKVIGVAFDGTGLGADGTLWGAEFLLCDYKNFTRAAHLKEIPLLGGEKAILEPWRLAAAWLYLLYGRKFLNLKINFVRNLDKDKWRILEKMRKINLNCPPASSMGRLFDAAGALILGKKNAAYEAELAVGLEKLASGFKVTSPCQQAGESQVTSYSFKIIKSSNGYIIDPAPIFKQIVSDFKDKQPKEKMAYKFHLATAEMVRKTCLLLRKDTGIKKVALSGGVWQNKLLLKTALDLLYKEGFMVLTQKNISCSDSGISLGQAVIANYRN